MQKSNKVPGRKLLVTQLLLLALALVLNLPFRKRAPWCGPRQPFWRPRSF
ncbi:hypothetical protein [Arthrobacter citreus]